MFKETYHLRQDAALNAGYDESVAYPDTSITVVVSPGGFFTCETGNREVHWNDPSITVLAVFEGGEVVVNNVEEVERAAKERLAVHDAERVAAREAYVAAREAYERETPEERSHRFGRALWTYTPRYEAGDQLYSFRSNNLRIVEVVSYRGEPAYKVRYDDHWRPSFFPEEETIPCSKLDPYLSPAEFYKPRYEPGVSLAYGGRALTIEGIRKTYDVHRGRAPIMVYDVRYGNGKTDTLLCYAVDRRGAPLTQRKRNHD